MAVAEIVTGENASVGYLPESDETLPPIGQTGTQRIECARRFAHMRMHTALHPLSVVIPLPVTGGRITAAKVRLAFDMVDPPGCRRGSTAIWRSETSGSPRPICPPDRNW